MTPPFWKSPRPPFLLGSTLCDAGNRCSIVMTVFYPWIIGVCSLLHVFHCTYTIFPLVRFFLKRGSGTHCKVSRSDPTTQGLELQRLTPAVPLKRLFHIAWKYSFFSWHVSVRSRLGSRVEWQWKYMKLGSEISNDWGSGRRFAALTSRRKKISSLTSVPQGHEDLLRRFKNISESEGLSYLVCSCKMHSFSELPGGCDHSLRSQSYNDRATLMKSTKGSVQVVWSFCCPTLNC
jgi:hypothetical protein